MCFKTFGAGKLVGDTSGYNQPLRKRSRGKVSSGGADGTEATLLRLPGDLVPVKGVPLAFPNSVAATDAHVYVADMVNLRLLRLKKQFRAEATSR